MVWQIRGAFGRPFCVRYAYCARMGGVHRVGALACAVVALAGCGGGGDKTTGGGSAKAKAGRPQPTGPALVASLPKPTKQYLDAVQMVCIAQRGRGVPKLPRTPGAMPAYARKLLPFAIKRIA